MMRVLRRGGTAWRLLDKSSPLAFVDSLRFLGLFRTAGRYSMLGVFRLATVYGLARRIERERIDGDIVECGVWNGGSAALMARAVRRNPRRTIWLFDSFLGMPSPGEHDGREAHAQYFDGWCKGSVEEVRRAAREMGVLEDRLRIVPGWFRDTFPGAAIDRIALLHVDADWYESVRDALERFYDHVTPGGYVVLDDYGAWQGCRKAADEFIAARGLTVTLRRSDESGVYFRKP